MILKYYLFLRLGTADAKVVVGETSNNTVSTTNSQPLLLTFTIYSLLYILKNSFIFLFLLFLSYRL